MTDFEKASVDERAQHIQDLLALQKSEEAKARLEVLLAPDAADVITALEGDLSMKALKLLPIADAAEVISYLPVEVRFELADHFDDSELALLLAEMEPDDRPLLLETLPEERIPDLLAKVEPKERQETEDLLSYPEESVGRWMTPYMITLREHWTVERSLHHIREVGEEAESFQTLYVIDEQNHLIDDIKIRQILLADPKIKVRQLMDHQCVSLNVHADQEEAVRVMERYDRPVLPVVDDHNRLLGVVTFDDIADIAEFEASEDIEKLGGMEALGERYSSVSLMHLFRKRVFWLMALFAGGILTIVAMSSFQDRLEQQAILALFVPLIIACGGNAGTQTASLMIRALALGDVSLPDWLTVVRRELISGILLGSVLGSFGFFTAFAVGWFLGASSPVSPVAIGLAIGLAIACVVICGTLVGSILPFLLGRFGIDPATSSSPTVTIIVDVVGLFVYFFIAGLVIGF